jgi:hypothetical protein
VGENNRERFRTFASLVNEVDANVIHLGFEMNKLIEFRFLLSPVVGVVPIIAEFPKVLEIGACIPTGTLDFMRSPCIFQSLPHVA